VIFYLDGGRVAESGSHEELLARGGRYAALYQLQSLTPTSAAPTTPSPVKVAGAAAAVVAATVVVA
jgi:hypothetical protein